MRLRAHQPASLAAADLHLKHPTGANPVVDAFARRKSSTLPSAGTSILADDVCRLVAGQITKNFATAQRTTC